MVRRAYSVFRKTDYHDGPPMLPRGDPKQATTELVESDPTSPKKSTFTNKPRIFRPFSSVVKVWG